MASSSLLVNLHISLLKEVPSKLSLQSSKKPREFLPRIPILLPNSTPIPQDLQAITLTHTIITATQAPHKDLEDRRKASNRKSLLLIKPNQLNPLPSNRPPQTTLVELKTSLAVVLTDLNKVVVVVEAPACSVENITKNLFMLTLY